MLCLINPLVTIRRPVLPWDWGPFQMLHVVHAPCRTTITFVYNNISREDSSSKEPLVFWGVTRRLECLDHFFFCRSKRDDLIWSIWIKSDWHFYNQFPQSVWESIVLTYLCDVKIHSRPDQSMTWLCVQHQFLWTCLELSSYLRFLYFCQHQPYL